MTPQFPHIDTRLGLHEEVDITYTVDPMFEATFWADDGSKPVAVGRGDTVMEAMADLDRKLGEGA